MLQNQPAHAKGLVTDHQLLMQAVGEFWAKLRSIRGPHGNFAPMYECTFDGQPLNYEAFLETRPARYELLPYQEQFAECFRAPEMLHQVASDVQRRFVMREMERFLTPFFDRPSCFEVFMPRDEKWNLPLAVPNADPPDARIICWWLTKRGIDYGRVRNVFREDGQTILRVSL